MRVFAFDFRRPAGKPGRRQAIAILAALLALTVAPANLGAAPSVSGSNGSLFHWMDSYRAHPRPAAGPAGIRTMSELGALKEVEASGFYVGFIAGVLGDNPKTAVAMARRVLPLPPGD